jgi:3'(2'), 5'-bisphosphate nucleotidase
MDEQGMDYTEELWAALEAATQAGNEILRRYAGFTAIVDAPADISTEADRQSQEIILGHLHNCFPNDAFCAEEATATLARMRRSGPRLWVIDPIDGTRGYARKNGEFSVMIGLVVEGTVAVGLVEEPARKRRTWAVRGAGCWRRDQGDQDARPCKVSGAANWQHATVVRSRSEIQHASSGGARQLFTYSAGIKLAMVARGEADVYLSNYNRFNSWDLCAGQILVEEAGGQVTDITGSQITYPPDGSSKIRGVVAATPVISAEALRQSQIKLAGS